MFILSYVLIILKNNFVEKELYTYSKFKKKTKHFNSRILGISL